ncbi:MAG: 3-hydroxyacyl-ACP dehydratase FabZ family protein [Candidatus Omnitrophota bacterium]
MPNPTVFCFIDKVAEVKKNQSLTALFTLTGSEEFLQDHFSGFPVMPGVLLLECLKQAAESLLALSGKAQAPPYRLTGVEDIRFGQFVKPGSDLKIFVQQLAGEGDAFSFEGRIDLLDGPDGASGKKALTARITLAPVGLS